MKPVIFNVTIIQIEYGCLWSLDVIVRDYVIFWHCMLTFHIMHTVMITRKCKNITMFFFQDSRLPLETQTIFYFFSIDFQVEKMLPDSAHSTPVSYYEMLRQLYRNQWSSMKMVGNVEVFHNIIDIDESLFAKKKYNRGRPTIKQWVFG